MLKIYVFIKNYTSLFLDILFMSFTFIKFTSVTSRAHSNVGRLKQAGKREEGVQNGERGCFLWCETRRASCQQVLYFLCVSFCCFFYCLLNTKVRQLMFNFYLKFVSRCFLLADFFCRNASILPTEPSTSRNILKAYRVQLQIVYQKLQKNVKFF